MTGWERIVDDLGTELYQEDLGGGGGCQCYNQGPAVAGRGGVEDSGVYGRALAGTLSLSVQVYCSSIDLQKCFNLC